MQYTRICSATIFFCSFIQPPISISLLYSRKVYRKAISLRDGNSSGTNGNVLLRDSSTDPLAMNSHNISTDEVCTKRFLLRFLFLLEISMRPIFCVYVREVEKPFTKKNITRLDYEKLSSKWSIEIPIAVLNEWRMGCRCPSQSILLFGKAKRN